MTSSLVGSEMCIRDRHLYSGTPSMESAPSMLDQSHLAEAALIPIPVSYTHMTLPTICSV
eukprot:10281826-Prorocentrum_lima.AAC.1